MSNRSGNDTQRSSISKSSSMKLESQTSEAMNKNVHDFNQKNQEKYQNKIPIKDLIRNDKLETIQENESYR